MAHSLLHPVPHSPPSLLLCYLSHVIPVPQLLSFTTVTSSVQLTITLRSPNSLLHGLSSSICIPISSVPTLPPSPPPAYSCHAHGCYGLLSREEICEEVQSHLEENSADPEHGGMGECSSGWARSVPVAGRLLRGPQYFLYPGVYILPNPPNFDYDGYSPTIRLYYTLGRKMGREDYLNGPDGIT